MSWIVGVDVGGTFTDFYAVSAADGEIRVAKRPSTRDNPGRAVIEGLGELAEGRGPARRGPAARARDHGGDQRHHPAPGREGGPHHDGRLP